MGDNLLALRCLIVVGYLLAGVILSPVVYFVLWVVYHILAL